MASGYSSQVRYQELKLLFSIILLCVAAQSKHSSSSAGCAHTYSVGIMRVNNTELHTNRLRRENRASPRSLTCVEAVVYLAEASQRYLPDIKTEEYLYAAARLDLPFARNANNRLTALASNFHVLRGTAAHECVHQGAYDETRIVNTAADITHDILLYYCLMLLRLRLRESGHEPRQRKQKTGRCLIDTQKGTPP